MVISFLDVDDLMMIPALELLKVFARFPNHRP